MNKKGVVIFILVLVSVIAIGVFIYINAKQLDVENKPTTLIFKLNSDYSGNYIGAINYYNNTNTYRSFGTFELFDYCYNTTTNNIIEDDNGDPAYEGETINQEVCYNLSINDIKAGIRKLNKDYFAVAVPNSEEMIKRFAVFDNSIITKAIDEGNRLSDVPEDFTKGIKPGMGDSIEMSQDEFYTYIIEDNPLIEAYFCDVPSNSLMIISTELSNGEVDNRCKKIV